MVDRLREDHENARLLAEGLARIDGISIDLETVQTNIVRFDLQGLGIPPKDFVTRLAEYSVKTGEDRMVTHRGIEREDIEYTLNVVESLVKKING